MSATPKVSPSSKPPRVVMFGASGFLAQDLARVLKEKGIPLEALGSTRLNLTQPESVAGIGEYIKTDDSLVVMSALTPDKGRDVGTFMRNMAMINHLCLALEKHSCRHLVYLSSDAVYADSDALISEETPISPRGLYAMMHAAREQMLEETLARLKVPLCVVRPCAVYGPKDTHNSYGPNRFIRTAKSAGKITLFGGGEEEREHVYVQDVSEFLLQCLLGRAEGTFNITSGQPISFMELAKLVARLCPAPVQIEQLPRTMPITHRRFDISLRRKLFPPLHITDLEKGLRSMIEALAVVS